MDAMSASHRPEAPVAWVTPNSADLARTRLDAAADPAARPATVVPDRPRWRDAVPDGPGGYTQPLLSGAAENYGRRGDIFSSSFRASSAEPPRMGGSGLSAFDRTAPSTVPSAMPERPRPTLTPGFDPMKPFDPAGRPLTDTQRRW